MENFIIPFIVPLVLGILFALAARSKPVVLYDNSILLQYGKVMKAIGIALPLGLWTIITFALFERPPENQDDMQAFILLFSFPFPFLGYFYLEFFKVRIVINKTIIKANTPWKGYREYFWSEIEEITYSPSFRWFQIRVKGKKTLYISAFITGINEFMNCVTTILPVSVYHKAIEKFGKG